MIHLKFLPFAFNILEFIISPYYKIFMALNKKLWYIAKQNCTLRGAYVRFNT